MRILYLCSDHGVPVLGAKGAAVHVRELVAAFRRAGHAVALAAPTLTKSPWEGPAAVDASVLHLPPTPAVEGCVRAVRSFTEKFGVAASLPGELRAVLAQDELLYQLTRRLDNARPDFVYERASLYGTAGAELARRLGVPRLVELNAPLALEHARYRGNGLGELGAAAELWSLRQADAVLAVSTPLRDHVVSLGVDPDVVHVVPNGVDPARFRPRPSDAAVRERYGLGDGPLLGFVGGLRSWHGVEALPGLLERLATRYEGVRLLVVGDGPLREELTAELGRHGVLQHVVFTGFLPHEEIPEIIRALDVGVAPYSQPDHLWYASPLKVFEYMACGVPVVGADLGQTVEVVRHGETGLLYDHEDAEQLAAACERLLDDPDLRKRLGASASDDVRRHYTWDRNAARIEALALALASSRSGVA